MKFWWSFTIFGSYVGMFIAFVGVIGANGAPQQAAAAAVGIACAVIPYCMARAKSEWQLLEQNTIKKTEVKKESEK